MYNRILNLMDKGFNHRYEMIFEVKLKNSNDKQFLDPSVKDLKILAKTIGFTCSLKKLSAGKFKLRLNHVPQPVYGEIRHIVNETNELLGKNSLKLVFEQNV